MTVHAERQRQQAATGSGPTWASTMGRIGWVVLVVISIIGVLNHLLGVFTFASSEEEQLMFAMFAAVNAYATAVLLSPYRRRMRWAWLITWVEVAAFALVFPLTGGGVGLGYLVVAAIAALAQLATLPSFGRD
jgi:hypothetical protein